MKYLKNFYKNAIKGTMFESIEFILLMAVIILYICFPTDKYFFYIIATSIYIFNIVNRELANRKRMQEIAIYDTEIPIVLDRIIDEAFNEYFLLHKGFEQGKDYINAEEEQLILKTMVDSVSARLSVSTIAKLEAYYNKDKVPDIISSKIYMAITSYVAQTNTPIKDSSLVNKIDFTNTDESRNETIIRYL